MKRLPAVYLGGLLACLALLLYYPALKAPLSPVDDQAIVQWLLDHPDLSLAQIFAHTDSHYYRPLLWLSFWLDMRLWGAETSFLHLGNVLLHTLNVLLLWGVARRFSRLLEWSSPWPAFWAGALFAVHPLNVEAVTWIAGRSDVLAGSFVLLAAYILTFALQSGKLTCAWLALLILAPGVLVKETALFFVPAALLLFWCRPAAARNGSRHRRQGARRWWQGLPLLVLPAGYLGFRWLQGHEARLGLDSLAAQVAMPLPEAGRVLLTGLGFYSKKIFLPWPLNFTIYPLPDGYLWFGVVVLLLLGVLLWRRGLIGGLWLAAAAVGTSALLALLLRPAWTPVSERYMYIPLMFACMAGSFTLGRLTAITGRLPRQLFPALVVAVFALTSYQRNLLWQDNIALFRDAVAKSPEFPFARLTLGDLLIAAGQEVEGKTLILDTRAPKSLRNREFVDLKKAELAFKDGYFDLARSLIVSSRVPGTPLYFNFQSLLLKVDLQLLQLRQGEAREEIYGETLQLFDQLFEKTRDPFLLYRLGQLQLREGDLDAAARAFARAAQLAPEGADYRLSAQKLAEKLERP